MLQETSAGIGLPKPNSILHRLGWRFINVLQMVYLAVWSVFWISLAIFAIPVTGGRKIPLAMARRFWAPGVLRGAGARVEVQGGENIDWSRACIFVANHQSMIDIPLAFKVLPVNVRFVSKEELKWVPFIGWYLWAMGMIFIDRGQKHRAYASLERAAKLVRSGVHVFAFPEGTRTRDGTIGSFKKGLFLLAIRAGVPVIPVAIEGAHKVVPSQTFRVRPGTIRVAFGNPIPTEGLADADRGTLSTQVRAHIVQLHKSIGGAGSHA